MQKQEDAKGKLQNLDGWYCFRVLGILRGLKRSQHTNEHNNTKRRMFWSKLCKSNQNCAWNLAFTSCIYLTCCMEYVWTSSLWISIFQRAMYTTSKNTIDRQYTERGVAVVSTITSDTCIIVMSAWFCTKIINSERALFNAFFWAPVFHLDYCNQSDIQCTFC